MKQRSLSLGGDVTISGIIHIVPPGSTILLKFPDDALFDELETDVKWNHQMTTSMRVSWVRHGNLDHVSYAEVTYEETTFFPHDPTSVAQIG